MGWTAQCTRNRKQHKQSTRGPWQHPAKVFVFVQCMGCQGSGSGGEARIPQWGRLARLGGGHAHSGSRRSGKVETLGDGPVHGGPRLLLVETADNVRCCSDRCAHPRSGRCPCLPGSVRVHSLRNEPGRSVGGPHGSACRAKHCCGTGAQPSHCAPLRRSQRERMRSHTSFRSLRRRPCPIGSC